MNNEQSFWAKLINDPVALFTCLLTIATFSLSIAAFLQISDARTATIHAELKSEPQLQIIPKFVKNRVITEITNKGEDAAINLRIVCVARFTGEDEWNPRISGPLVLPGISMVHRLASNGESATFYPETCDHSTPNPSSSFDRFYIFIEYFTPWEDRKTEDWEFDHLSTYQAWQQVDPKEASKIYHAEIDRELQEAH